MLSVGCICNMCFAQRGTNDSIWSSARPKSALRKLPVATSLSGRPSRSGSCRLVTQEAFLCGQQPAPHPEADGCRSTDTSASQWPASRLHRLLRGLGTRCRDDDKGDRVASDPKGWLTGHALLVLGVTVRARPPPEEGQGEAHGSRRHPAGSPRALRLHLQREASAVGGRAHAPRPERASRSRTVWQETLWQPQRTPSGPQSRARGRRATTAAGPARAEACITYAQGRMQ